MEKRDPKYFLDKAPIRQRRSEIYKAPNCEDCDTPIKKGDKYVARNAHYHYCIPCAANRSKSIRTCLKKRVYLSPADVISRGRQMVKSRGVYQLPYHCPHCNKYHLTTVDKKTVPKQLLKIYQTDVLGPPLQQAIDRYCLEYDV